MTRLQILIVTSLLVAIPFELRGEVTNETTIQDVTQAGKDAAAAATTGRYTEQQLKDFKSAAETQVHKLKKKLDKMKSYALTQTGQAKVDIDEKIADADNKMSELKLKLKKLKTATTNNWSEIKSAFDKQLKDLKQVISDAPNHRSTAKG